MLCLMLVCFLVLFMQYIYYTRRSITGQLNNQFANSVDEISYTFCTVALFPVITILSLLLCLVCVCIVVTGRASIGFGYGIVFTQLPIFRFFAPQGRHVKPIKVKFSRENRTSVRSSCQISP